MSNASQRLAPDATMLRRTWGWFGALGVLLIILGVIGLALSEALGLVTVLILGWFFIVGGIIEVVHTIARRGWRGFWLDLFSGVLTVVVGVMIVAHPVGAKVTLTLIIGVMFLVGGIMRFGLGLSARNPYGGWAVLSGGVSALLGLMILADWPFSSLWVIGTLVAVDLIVDGARLLSLGLAARSLPASTEG